MKLQIVSDLHLEFYKNNQLLVPDYLGEDVLVLAGDIQLGLSSPRIQSWFADLLETRDVIYIFGNHEFYQQDYNTIVGKERTRFEEDVNKLKEERGFNHNLYVLDSEKVIIDDVLFVGCTLWTSIDNGDPNLIARASSIMNDFRLINNFDANFSCYTHNEHRNFIEDQLTDVQHKDLKKVVVTHHLPSEKSVSPRFKNSPINGFFKSDLDDLITKSDIWICGHTHDSHWYYIDDSIVVCNPFGYINREENPYFSKNFVIDTENLPSKIEVKDDPWREKC